MSHRFYVYEHWRPDKDICFYVGKGKGRRANVMYGRGSHHERIQEKLKRLGMCVEVRLVMEGLSEEKAHAIEMGRIAWWRCQGVELVNKTAGGEGASDPVPEVRAKMRAAKLGKLLSDEHKAKIGQSSRVAQEKPDVKERHRNAMESVRARPGEAERIRNLHLLIPRTKEHYEKVSAALTGRKLSVEHAAKSRVASLGRKQSAEEIEKRRIANKGKVRSDEFRRQMQEMWTPERKEAKRQETIARNTVHQDPTGIMRKCLRCNEIKDTCNFGKRKLSPDGIHVYCKDCRKAERARGLVETK